MVLWWGKITRVLVIESLEHAQNDGANILAELVMVQAVMPTIWQHRHQMVPECSQSAVVAINEAGIKPEDVDYVNAHVSTPANERWKRNVFLYLVKVPVSSTKSFTGHL